MLFFNRKADIVIAFDSLDRTQVESKLREELGDKYQTSDWEVLPLMGRAVRIRAIGPNHLDVTTIPLPGYLT